MHELLIHELFPTPVNKRPVRISHIVYHFQLYVQNNELQFMSYEEILKNIIFTIWLAISCVTFVTASKLLQCKYAQNMHRIGINAFITFFQLKLM